MFENDINLNNSEHKQFCSKNKQNKLKFKHQFKDINNKDYMYK